MSLKTLVVLFCSLAGMSSACPQTRSQGSSVVIARLRAAVYQLEADSSMRHGTVGFRVVDAQTGLVLFEKNPQTGLAPASCQKLLTSAAVLDILQPDYRYRTQIGYDGRIEGNVLKGNLYLMGSGDPTLGSWRYDSTNGEAVWGRLVRSLKNAGIRQFTGNLIVDDSRCGDDVIPRGWIWEDIGNYYGAGAWGLNWHENQFDIHLLSGKKIGDPVMISSVEGETSSVQFINELITGASGSGDNAYIYQQPFSSVGVIRGSVPLQKAERVISGSLSQPPQLAGELLLQACEREGIRSSETSGHVRVFSQMLRTATAHPAGHPDQIVGESLSPTLDSINYWFLKKSINLYGEALLKTLAFEKTGVASTEKGTELLRDFWAARGIERSAIRVVDGSGLSPQNRVTAAALVQVLQYARTRPWFNAFYQSLPIINGMHMKSGAIGGARSYSGYQAGSDGRQYIFSIIVNNFDGPAATAVKNLLDILNLLKDH